MTLKPFANSVKGCRVIEKISRPILLTDGVNALHDENARSNREERKDISNNNYAEESDLILSEFGQLADTIDVNKVSGALVVPDGGCIAAKESIQIVCEGNVQLSRCEKSCSTSSCVTSVVRTLWPNMSGSYMGFRRK